VGTNNKKIKNTCGNSLLPHVFNQTNKKSKKNDQKNNQKKNYYYNYITHTHTQNDTC